MKRYLVIIFILNILLQNSSFATNNVHLDIKVKKITDQGVNCDFIYMFNLEKNEYIREYALFLPFKDNPELSLSLLNNHSNLLFTYGFKNDNRGIALFNSLNDAVNFKAEFLNVYLPIKEVSSSENGLLINLDLVYEKRPFPFESPYCKFLVVNDVTIETKSIIDSKPKFELSEKGAGFFNIKLGENIESSYFIIPLPPESYISIFFVLLLIAIGFGIVSAVRIIEGKLQSIFGLALSGISLLSFLYLFYHKVIPTDFNKDLDMISLVGGGIGFSLGVLFNSTYNLIVFDTINRQQSIQGP